MLLPSPQGAGIVVDVFALPPAGTGTTPGAPFMDLGTVAPLARASGGLLALYPPTSPAAQTKATPLLASPSSAGHPLARDVHRLMAGPAALHCTLKLRCSPELRPARVYGPFVGSARDGNVSRGDEVHLMGACGYVLLFACGVCHAAVG